MSDQITDPVEKLLVKDAAKEDMLRQLGLAQRSLLEDVREFREAWKAATGVGWATADLKKAGFCDPARLPRQASPRDSNRRRTPALADADTVEE